MIDVSYAAFLKEDELAHERAIMKARRYHEGVQPVALTDRLREFLGLGDRQSSTTGGMFNDRDLSPFVMNITRLVVDAVAERMLVAGFDTDEPDEKAGQPLPTPVATWAWETWLRNRMDAKQDEVHTGAIRDGEYFVIVDWDEDNQRARFTPHPRFTDAAEVGGDGMGCQMYYPDDDDSQRPIYATKRWTEISFDDAGKRHTEQRKNYYYPDRIEQKHLVSGRWEQYAPTIAWTAAGKPLGIAVIHFRNVALRCEAWDAFPLQDALNKAMIDLVAASDLTAFRVFFVTGMFPTEDGLAPAADGSNAMRLSPGAMFGTMNKDGKVTVIDGADLSNLQAHKDGLILDIAAITSTPASRFITTKQVAAEGTLKQQEGPLLAKITKRQALIGNAWEDVYRLARRLANMHGEALSEDVEISTRWAAAETRDDAGEAARLTLEQTLGVPAQVLWKKLGYTPTEIAAMQEMKDEAAVQEMERQQALIQARGPMVVNGVH